MIVSEKFTLRGWQADDAGTLAAAANNYKIWLNLRDGFPHPYTLDDAKAFIRSLGQLPNVFAIEVDGRTVGSIGYFPHTDVEQLNAEVGYWLAEEYWGRGIMSEVVRVLAGYIFDNTELIRLYATPFEYNTASMRVLEKAGFSKVGVMHSAAIKNNEIIDLHYFELVK